MKSKFFLALVVLVGAVRIEAQNYGFTVDNALGVVNVIDLNSRTMIDPIPSGQQASEMLILPNNRVAFVSNQGDNNVAAISLFSYLPIAKIPTGQGPGSLAASPDGRFVYVADVVSNDVTVIDAVAMAAVTTIPVDVSPVQVNISPNGRFLYVVNQDAEPTGTITVIDTNRNQVIGALAVGLKPAQFAISPNLATAYVVNTGSNNVSVVDLASNQVTGTIAVGAGPTSVAFSTDGSILYVVNQAGNSVSVVSTAQNREVTKIPVGSQPAAMVVTFDSLYGYVTNQGSNSVSVLTLGTSNTNDDTINTGSGPFSLALDPNENNLYVTNVNSGNVTVIDVNTDKVVKTISVGGSPVQFTQFNAPTLLEVAPNPAPAGGTVVLNGEGFLPSSVVRFAVIGAEAKLTPTFLDSQGLQVTAPQFGRSSGVSVANPDGNTSEVITLNTGTASPVIFSHGVVEGAGFQRPPYPISGNSVVDVFGLFPGITTAQPPSFPIPTTLGNVSVTYNGVPAYLIATQPGQINTVAPMRLLGQSSVRVAVTAQGQTSAAQTVNVAPVAASGILMFSSDGVGAFVHGTRLANAVSPSDPAHRGEVITMYLTGMGNTVPPPIEGQAAPFDVLSVTTTQPVVTVGGEPAQVLASVLVPPYYYLDQINFVVPQSVPSANDVSVTVTAGGNTSNTVKLAVQ